MIIFLYKLKRNEKLNNKKVSNNEMRDPHIGWSSNQICECLKRWTWLVREWAAELHVRSVKKNKRTLSLSIETHFQRSKLSYIISLLASAILGIVLLIMPGSAIHTI